jgi:spore germination cell wall hydrolase CwlJ-like protein
MCPLDLDYQKSFKDLKGIPKNQLDCLVKNIYHEAIGEGVVGILIVNQVVFNRTKDEDYCSTIFKKNQFSWTLYKEKKIAKETYDYLAMLTLNQYNGLLGIPLKFENATHFHADYVKPYWRKKLTYLGSWNNHHFYKE